MPVSGMQAIAGAEDNESSRIFQLDRRPGADGNQETETVSPERGMRKCQCQSSVPCFVINNPLLSETCYFKVSRFNEQKGLLVHSYLNRITILHQQFSIEYIDNEVNDDVSQQFLKLELQ